MAYKFDTCFFLPDGIICQGNWTNRIYHEEDVVTFNGAPYVCIKDTTDPDLDPESSVHWRPFDPRDYVSTTWSPKCYPEGSLVSYKNDVYMCFTKATLEPPTDTSHWTKAKYKFRGYWQKQVYEPGKVVRYKKQYYRCIKRAFHQNPNNYTHWENIPKPESGYHSDWMPMKYEVHDIVTYQDLLYVCISAVSLENPFDDQYWKPLPKNAKWRGQWQKDVYPKNTLVLDKEKNLYVSRTEATDEPLTDAAWFALKFINWRDKWLYKSYRAGDYLIYDQRAFICIKDTDLAEHPTDPNHWARFCEGGVEFPAWFPSPRSIEIAIPFDTDLSYSPSSGGYSWPINPPKYLGFEEIKTEQMFEENRPYFENLGIKKVKQVYLLTEWHVGNFEEATFYGAVIDGYYEPPNIGGTQLTQDLIPMTNPKNGKPGYRFYIQWRAGELPFIAQPGTTDGFGLVLFNREPHEKVTEFFKVANNQIQLSNRMRMDKAAFEDEMRDVISHNAYREYVNRKVNMAEAKGEVAEPISYDEYVEENLAAWTQNKYQMKMKRLELGNALFKRAEEQTANWLKHREKELRDRTREISTRITTKVQHHLSWETWFNMTAVECKKQYPKIMVGDYSLADIEKKRIEVEKLWEVYEAGPLMGKIKFLDYLERDTDEVLSMLPARTNKRRNRRKKNKK